MASKKSKVKKKKKKEVTVQLQYQPYPADIFLRYFKRGLVNSRDRASLLT